MDAPTPTSPNPRWIQAKSGRLWIDIDTWGHLAGTCHQHLAQGRHILVSGRLSQKQWADATTGEKRTRYVVTAREVDFLTNDRKDPRDPDRSASAGLRHA